MMTGLDTINRALLLVLDDQYVFFNAILFTT